MNDASFSTEEGGCLHFGTGLAWSLAPLAKMEYAKAEEYCRSLVEAGKSDWRLPTSGEMQAAGAGRGALDHFEFQTHDFFWAKTAGTGLDGWTVELAGAEKAQAERAAKSGRALCVRAPEDIDGDGVPDSSDQCNMTPRTSGARTPVETIGPNKGCASSSDRRVSAAWPRRLRLLGCKEETSYFRTGAAGCVHSKTGLEWSRVSENPQQRRYAERYCDSLTEGIEGGYQDWRLPTSAELHAIAGAEFAVRHFKFDVNRDFWTSTFRSRSGRFFSYRPNGEILFEERPQLTVNLTSGNVAGVATQTMARFGDPSRNYSEGLVPVNEEFPLSVVCVRTPSR